MVNLRIFVSSPGDVGEERRLTARVIERLAFEWKGRVHLEPIFWEHEPLRASASFQEQLPLPSDSDIVLCVLWSRLGTRLPPTLTREDGSIYASGTEFEFEDALRAYRRNGVPDLLVYRRTSRPLTELDSEERVIERLEQKKALDAFLDRWFLHAEGYLTSAFHTFAEPAQLEKLLEQHLRRLIEERWQRAGGEEGVAHSLLWDQGSPFRGLQTFERAHAAVFCGRTAEISEVLNAMRRQDSAGKPFVLVVGMSGCGKSSLVRAGVLPELTFPNVIEGIGLWRVATLVPGRTAGDLLGGLAHALLEEGALGELRTGGTADGAISPGELAELLRERPGAAVPIIRSGLARVAQQVQRQESLASEPPARLALLIDQLEELFTSEGISAETRQRFDLALTTLVRSGTVWAVATLRSDFYARCSELEGLMSLKEGAGQYDLKPPASAALGHMVRQPARIAGLRFEEIPSTGERLDDLLMNEAARDPEALPLLEFTLDELYRRRRGDGLLTIAAYRELGGVEGALAHQAEEVFLDLPPEAQQALPTVLPGLVTLNPEEDSTVTRRRSSYADLTSAPGSRVLVDAFVRHRLLVTDRAEDGTSVVSIAHEALLRRWPRARQWLDDNDALLKTCARLKMAAALWHQSGEESSFLLPEGELLANGMALLAVGQVPLGGAETALVRASGSTLAAERRRRRRRVAGGVAAGLALALGLLVYLYLFSFPNYQYFENFVLREGVPEGVLAVDKPGRRQWSLRFQRRGRLGRVEMIEAVDAEGRLTPEHQVGRHISGFRSAETDPTDLAARPCRWCFDYDETGKLLREIGRSCFSSSTGPTGASAPSTEKRPAEDDCPGGTVHEFIYKPRTDEDGTVLAEYVGQGLATPQAESGAALVEFTRTPEGFDQRTRYLDVRGRPAADSDGSYGQMVERFADNGLPLSVVNLGPDGFAAVHRQGFVRTELTYDSDGRMQWLRFRDQQGKPAPTRFGFASARLSYDDNGNLTELRQFGPDDLPLTPIARAEMRYDRRGNLVQTTLFQADGHRARHAEGWSAIRWEYRKRETAPGRVVSLFLLDPDDEPITVRGGFARLDREFDEAGNLVTEAYFDVHQQPVGRSDGVARETYRYERGKLAEESSFGVDGELIVPIHRGYATVRRTYDGRQRLLEESFFDSTGKATRDAQGVWRRRLAYDEDGHLVSQVYLDSAGERTRSWRGEAEVRLEYDDEKGHGVEAYLDVDHGSMAVRWIEFNGGGREYVPEGCAYRWVRERRGRPVELRCLDQRQEPVEILGCLRVTFEYDALGREIERACLDANGELASFDGGFGGYRTAYDDRGNAIGWSYFSSRSRSQPAPVLGDVTGVRWSYDQLGNQVAESYVDATGQPTRHPYGHTRVETDYDTWGRPIQRHYLGPSDNLVRTSQGFARETEVHGPRGELLEVAYANEHGAATLSADGYARATYAYGPKGEETEIRYYDEDDDLLRSGLAWVEIEYEPDGTRRDIPFDASGRRLRSETAHRFDPLRKPGSPPRQQRAEVRAAESPPTSIATGLSSPPGSDDEPVPTSRDLTATVDRLAVLAEAIQDSYEEFLDAEDRDPKGREGEIEGLFGQLEDAADGLRKAYRTATGQRQGLGRAVSWVRGRVGPDQAAVLERRASEAVRLGDALAPLVAEYGVGSRALEQWREIRSLLDRIRAELL